MIPSDTAGLSEHVLFVVQLDLPEAEQRLRHLRDWCDSRWEIIAVSAKFGTNLLNLLRHVRASYDAFHGDSVS